MTRVAVFFDYQNVYMGAREVFGWRHHHFTYGQVYPRQLGLVLTDLGRTIDPARRLSEVQVFRGEPSAKHSPGGQAACQRQVEYWNAQGLVRGVTRPLKYHRTGTDADGQPTWEAREKGIDVLVALAMVTGAMRDEFDVAILMSGDSDLVPAVEQVLALGKRCEVAAWQAPLSRHTRLSVPGRKIWCHWLNEQVYRQVCDPTDYTRQQPGGPAAVPQSVDPP